MSTAGKVLSVMLALMTLVGVFLLAKVADYNSNWGAELTKQVAAVDKATDTRVILAAELVERRAAMTVELMSRDKDLTVLRRQLSAAQKAEIESIEAQDRVKLQLASVQSQVAGSEAEKQQRIKERDAAKQQLADARAAVDALKGQNSTLLAELTKLREDFTKTLADNRERLRAAGDAR